MTKSQAIDTLNSIKTTLSLLQERVAEVQHFLDQEEVAPVAEVDFSDAIKPREFTAPKPSEDFDADAMAAMVMAGR